MKPRIFGRLLVGIPLLVVAAHCKELPLESSLAPRNDCSEHPCQGYQQEGVPVCDRVGQFCKLNSTLDFTLLISTAAGSPAYSMPATAVMKSSDLEAVVAPQICPDGVQCAYIPSLVSALGWYQFDPAAQNTLGRNLGNPAFTTISQHTTWYPLAYDKPSTPPKDPVDTPLSTDFGIPALPVFTPMLVPIPPRSIESLEDRDKPGPGPFGSPSIGWAVSLPAGRYLRVISPDPPFDQVFPPHEQVIDFVGAAFQRVNITSNELDTDPRTFRISPDSSSGPPQDLTGWTAVLQNSVRHRNISRMATLLHSGMNEVTLYTVGHPSLQNVSAELVVAPPPTVLGVPSLIVPALPIISRQPPYPFVPPPANVTGQVVGPDGAPVRATMVFRSVDKPGALVSRPSNVLLRYATTIQTDPFGTFQVPLPLGQYNVAIFPDPSTPEAVPLALWVGTMTVDGSGPKSFPVVRQTEVRGAVVLADGIAVAEASVEAKAAVTPSNPGPFAQAMRSVRTTTDATGAFSLQLDPGDYDIVVRPRVGTRFPWVVSTSHKIADTPVTLDRLVVPAPIAVSVTLVSRARNIQPEDLVRGALVRAFAVPKCPVGQSCGNRAVEIGQAVTDANGKLELFLTEPRNVSAKPPN
ncbi:carboxypeptidase-like regulatory domain-containing protein [Pendulispora rubella]|uniref:Carboxypeptidase-like regulatory domain-containing protein n=1 Tax=Pendulispora rubella TaxID=2741070 RepID=A0ABZ2LGZ2_9BACT